MINPVGYIKIHRELAIKPIWDGSNLEQKVILVTLLMMANYNEKQWEWKGKKFTAMPGQFVTSLDNIAKTSGDGISIRNVRTALKRFENFGFLTNESTKTGRLITIVNWASYQSQDKQVTKGRQSKMTQSSKKEDNSTNELTKKVTEQAGAISGINKGSERTHIDELTINPTKDLTDSRQRGDKQPTTREERKKVRNKEEDIYRRVQHLELSVKENAKLLQKHTQEEIDEVLDDMENYAKLKNYKSAYLTANKWLKMRLGGKGATDIGQTVDPEKTRAQRQAERYREKLKKGREEHDD